MKMRSMELTKSEAKGEGPALSAKEVEDGPRFPYGLEVRLENQTLEKLGIDALPKVGTYVKIRAKCCVTSVSSNEHQRGKPNRRVSLQIERLAVDREPQSMEEAVEMGVQEA